MFQRIVVFLAINFVAVHSLAADPKTRTCNVEGCHTAIQLSEEREQCVRVVLPSKVDGTLDRLWMSRMEPELASRLNGEACIGVEYFGLDTEEMDLVFPAMKLLYRSLRVDQTLLRNEGVDDATFQCLIGSGSPRVHNVELVHGNHDARDVLFEIEGCEKGVLEVVASIRLEGAVDFEEKIQANVVKLSYSPRANPGPSQ